MTNQLLQLSTVSISIFHLTNINTILLNSNGSIHLLHECDSLPDFMYEVQQNEFLILCSEVQQSPDQVILYTNEWGLTYLAGMLPINGDEPNILVIGPFLMQVPDTNRLYTKMNIDQRKHIQLEEFYRGLKLIGSSRVQSIANIMEQAGSIRQASVQIADRHEALMKASQPVNNQILQQPDKALMETIELRYKMEKEMMQAVELGDILSLKQIQSKVKNLYDFSERFPNQPVRAMKNSIIIINTLYRIAAEKGSVHPFFLHQLSEKFSKQIERCETIDSLRSLMGVMASEYCEMVRHRAVSGYSLIVKKAIEYIHIHFSKPLNLKDLSAYCLVHPAHLSRQFKKEVGMTLTDFQQKRRISEAKEWLKADASSIGRIAGYVGFEDAGHFTRIFKKLEGMTPSQYRNPKDTG